MTSYADAGVDIQAGDEASRIAYKKALETFSVREGKIGCPVKDVGGFAGLLDFGDYYLVMCCDSVGTKIDVSIIMDSYKGLGYDLLAMTADDAVCAGAELVGITNTIDTKKINAHQIEAMMESLKNACIEQKVTIPGGEIAETGDSVSGTLWDCSAVGVVEKDRVINSLRVKPGDVILSLREKGFRANGMSLVRHIMKEKNIDYFDIWKDDMTYGEAILTPSTVYHNGVLNMIGRYKEERKIPVKAIAHITGGGIDGNLQRILKKVQCGAILDDLWRPGEIVQTFKELGGVDDKEAYNTWNMGNGMMIILEEKYIDSAIEILSKSNIEAKMSGVIVKEKQVRIKIPNSDVCLDYDVK